MPVLGTAGALVSRPVSSATAMMGRRHKHDKQHRHRQKVSAAGGLVAFAIGGFHGWGFLSVGLVAGRARGLPIYMRPQADTARGAGRAPGLVRGKSYVYMVSCCRKNYNAVTGRPCVKSRNCRRRLGAGSSRGALHGACTACYNNSVPHTKRQGGRRPAHRRSCCMNVLMINGSPHEKGCTWAALSEVEARTGKGRHRDHHLPHRQGAGRRLRGLRAAAPGPASACSAGRRRTCCRWWKRPTASCSARRCTTPPPRPACWALCIG